MKTSMNGWMDGWIKEGCMDNGWMYDGCIDG